MDTLRSRHRIITLSHGLTGLLTAVWGAGLPALDVRLDLGPAALGAMLLTVAGCALVAMRAGGRLGRSGERMLAVALPIAGVALVLAGVAASLPVLVVAAGLFGAACGVINIALSTEAMRVESAIGRPVIARMHGFWTLGAAGGGLLLAGVLHAGLDSRLAISGTAALLVTASLLVAVRLRTLPAGTDHAHTPAPDSRPEPSSNDRTAPAIGNGPLIALGLLGAAAFVTEGAATDWAGVHAVRALGADPAAGSLVYGVFFLAMTVMRFCGDALRQAIGPLHTVRLTGTLAVIGYVAILISGLVPGTPIAVAVALFGWALAGAGTALVWPIVIGTLAERGESARRLSLVTMVSYGGGLLGPAMIGFLASAVSLPTAMLLPAGLALLVATIAPAAIRRCRSIRPSTIPTTPSTDHAVSDTTRTI
ncbi:MFS transporter [Microbacterium sp. PMB16]|uniref:MFS transporter n=1 Tax=Microbacterium sp. PMB16 TaxID=3120157 RepID=UPI003F4B9DD6